MVLSNVTFHVTVKFAGRGDTSLSKSLTECFVHVLV